MMTMLRRCIDGHFINFAICDFYKDDSFLNLSVLMFKSIMNQEMKEIRLYDTLHKEMYAFVEVFVKKNLEMLFVKIDNFDNTIVPYIVEQILIPGAELDNNEI